MDSVHGVKNCCGCRACEQICPKHCITMKEDAEGFYIPSIDEAQCIHCGKCLKCCPQYSYAFKNKVQKTYAALHSDHEILMKSTSGGAMSALVADVIKNNGVVFGTYLDTKDWRVKFREADTMKKVEHFRGSKYVQADTGNAYSKVKVYLQSGRQVAFVGTPCQVAGLYSYLGNTDTKNLLTMDILCHGVPAPSLFVKHIQYIEKKYHKTLTGFSFRDKKKFPNKTALRYDFGDKHKYVLGRCEEYFEVFISGSAYRSCCYQCKFSQTSRPGDITLGDYWGILNHHKGYDNSMGVSLVLANTTKGLKTISESGLVLTESKLEYAVEGNGILKHPSQKSKCRDVFYKDVNTLGYEATLKKHIKTYPQMYNFILTHTPGFIITILAKIKK